MKQYIVELSDAEDKALHTVVIDGQEWINNVIHERCRIAVDEIVNSEIKRKMDAGEPITGTKEDIVINSNVKTLLELQQESLIP